MKPAYFIEVGNIAHDNKLIISWYSRYEIISTFSLITFRGISESQMSEWVEIMPCWEFPESYLQPLKHLKEHPLAEKSK